MDDDIKKTAEQIFVNPKVAQRIVDMATSDKPMGWSPRSNSPYFKKMYAEEIRPFVDQMLVDGQDIIYRYSVWCKDGMSPQTVYNRVNQSIRYLCEKILPIEDRQKYIDWYERVHVSRDRGMGVRIRMIVATSSSENAPKPESVTPQNQAPLWYRKMDEWLEDDENFEPFIKDNLALNADEIQSLKIRLAGLSNIKASITERRVAIIRIA